MIKSLFRQMWNQRHANVWVWVELIVVLILLWYSIDLVYKICAFLPLLGFLTIFLPDNRQKA